MVPKKGSHRGFDIKMFEPKIKYIFPEGNLFLSRFYLIKNKNKKLSHSKLNNFDLLDVLYILSPKSFETQEYISQVLVESHSSLTLHN